MRYYSAPTPWIAGLLLVGASTCCSAQPSKTPKEMVNRAPVAVFFPDRYDALTAPPDPRELHLAIHSANPLTAVQPQPGASALTLPIVQPTKLSISTSSLVEPTLIEKVTRVHLDTVGGPEPIGCSRPNGWSGLQTTIPNGVPGRTTGITFMHF